MSVKHLARRCLVGAACLLALGVQAEDLNAVATPVDLVKRQAAHEVSQLLNDPDFAASLAQRMKVEAKPGQAKAASLRNVLAQYERVQRFAGKQVVNSQGLKRLDQEALRHKGLQGYSDGLLQVRLYQPTASTEVSLANTLVAFEPAGDDKQWKVIEAYDRQGNVHRFDARSAPNVPVLVADIDAREDMRAGLKLINQALRQHGMQTAPGKLAQQARAQAGGYVDTAKLDRISVKDDQEPWISGAAEVYALVSGVQPDQAKAQIVAVDMPYLDYSGTTYNPNQILIQWADFRYAAANVLFYEHDDNTNYKDLVLALTSGVEKILGVFKPEFAIIATVANAIVQAMPSHWFANDDDYMDAFYTLEKNRAYTDWAGVGGNVVMTLTPYRLNEQ
ncbi:DUF3103 family protein [Chitinimonas sp. JJ19]|uniref:DUF3103 family protein n=1 Tax=Chitinimonas sp. JJ19 TaxID=3109352 RepID=UPI003002D979